MRFLNILETKFMASTKKVIVIGRQFGSGGQELGKLLSEKLGIPYYDKNLLYEVAEKYGYDKSVFDNADERKPSFFRSILSMTYGATYTDTMGNYLCNERLYDAQSKIIRELASENDCIFVGRTADYITRDFPNMISIFLHADISDRANRICCRCECNNINNAIELAKKQDKLREDYYNYFTGKNWGNAANYDMCFNTAKLSIAEIADIIISQIKNK